MHQQNTHITPPRTPTNEQLNASLRSSTHLERKEQLLSPGSSVLAATVSRLLEEKQEQMRALHQKDAEICELKLALEKAQGKLSKISIISDPNTPFPSQTDYKERIHALQARIDGDIRRREQLEKDLKWSHGRIKEQLIEVEKLKHTIGVREGFIKQLVSERKDNEREDEDRRLRRQATPITSVFQNSVLNDSRSKEKGTTERGINTDLFEEKGSGSSFGLEPSRFALNQSINRKQNQDTYYRHSSEMDKKDRALKKLAEKCFMLQSHIEVLTHQLLDFMSHRPVSPPKTVHTALTPSKKHFLLSTQRISPFQAES